MNMSQGFLERPTGRLAYSLTGIGPLVVCIPGMGDLRSHYDRLAADLSAAGFRVATFDLRGHGDSDLSFDAWDDCAAGADALALVEHLGGPAVLAGSSMGAGAAVWAAAERPDLVRGLALLGPFVRDPQTGLAGALTGLMFRVMLARPWGPRIWRGYLARLTPGRPDDTFRAHRDLIMAALRRPGRWRAFQLTARTSHEPARARIGEVDVPVVAVMGTKDPDWSDPAAEAAWIGSALKARVVMVEGAGHYPHAEYPEITSPAVIELATRAHARA